MTRSEKPASGSRSTAIAALAEIAAAEAQAGRPDAAASVAEIACAFAADDSSAQRLLGPLASTPVDATVPAEQQGAHYHLARAKAFRVIADTQQAEAEFHAALASNPDLVEAHIGLSELRLPGEGYLTWLQRLHDVLRPQFYLEIGVEFGHTLSLAQPPTRAIGIDPQPRIAVPLHTEAHVFTETSDDFFAKGHLRSLLGENALGLAFIDGEHVFAQSLRDFMHVEAFCGETSVVLLHDTIPLDEITQKPERQRTFYTGDVWKTVLCLKHYRPDLDIFTIATPWSGLTAVTGLDPNSSKLAHCYDEAVATFGPLRYSDFETKFESAVNIVSNDWTIVEARLRARSLL